MNRGHVVEATQIAERGKFDAVFLADGNAVSVGTALSSPFALAGRALSPE